jgi:hypothetical protein
MSDFDNPSYYNLDAEIPQYTSPVLLPYTKSTAVGTGTPSSISDAFPDAEIWTKWPWNQWYQNYLLSVDDVIIIDGGTGYTEPPVVVVTGDCVTPAQMTAIINSAGKVVGVEIINPGEGYSTTAIITFVGGNGIAARAYAVMNNSLVRSIKTTIKYDRYQYQSTIVNWVSNVSYAQGTQVRYDDRVWSANSNVQTIEFDTDDWTSVSAGSLSGVDRTQGFYVPTLSEPGLQLPLLIDGLEYPGVQVSGVGFNQNTGFDIGNFDINPYDNISYGPEGKPTYDTALLDAIYESSYLDPFLGTRATDVNVDGGAYIDTYSSFAPEELVPGAEFDTLDMRVYTRAGADWAQNGHGYPTWTSSIIVESLPTVINFSNYLEHVPYMITGSVTNRTTGVALVEGFSVNWVDKEITITSDASVNIGDVLLATGSGVGGGNQIYRQNYLGSDIGNTVTVPVQYSQIQEIDVWVNGRVYTNLTYAAGANNTTVINFGTTFTSSQWVVVYVLGPTTVDNTTVNYSWSAPTTQIIIADGSTVLFDLDNSLEYTNPANMIVTVNGIRARTAAGVEYFGDGSSAYLLPDRLGFSQALIADNEVLVYINDIPQVLGVDYTVEPFGSDGRHVVFATTPSVGERILISVTTNTQARITSGSSLFFDITQGIVPIAGDIITVTTWNDTRQQELVTLVYVGPVSSGATVVEGFDSTDFDVASISGEPGSFDYAEGVIVQNNNLFLTRTPIDPNKLWVNLNGFRLFYGSDFTILNNEIILASGILNANDVVMITEFSDSIVPDEMAFRIFQDMRGVQATYKITTTTTTTLTQDVGLSDDIIYVDNASNLDQPDIAANIWGIVTINGERIMYRDRDTVNNTISSLLRGTGGTAIAEHNSGDYVYAMARGEIMPVEFQNYINSNSFLGNGVTVSFEATDITFDSSDSALIVDAVEVWVGGSRVTDGYIITDSAPVNVVFDTAPASGVDVTILVRRGVTWYAPGDGTPSNGVALQDTNTQAARFLRGL